MSKIIVLDKLISNKIAAGEVVERPASVIKELVENSIDAQSTAIAIEIVDGGITYMRVADNGVGMDEDDAKTAFLRHATSKLKSEEDLYAIASLGFRGEALASIAAVSKVSLKTHTDSAEYGPAVSISGGIMESVLPCGCPTGTTIEVKDLFYNVPARLKFLKAARTEASYIIDYVARMILARPDISFKLTSNGKVIYHSRGDSNLKNAIYSVHGAEFMPHLKEVSYNDGAISITGYVGTEHISRSTRQHQSVFVNGRYIRSALISQAVSEAYDTRIMAGRFPFFVLSVKIDYSEVDVNVHPNKMEVRFRDEHRVSAAVTEAAKHALGASQVPLYFVEQPSTPETKFIADESETEAPQDIEAANISEDTQQKLKSIHEFIYGKAEPSPIIPESNTAEVFLSDSVEKAEENDLPPVFFSPKMQESKYEPVQLSFGIEPFDVLGCAFNSFWFFTQNDTVFIVDQHAAHERMLYEGLMKGTLASDTQLLLVPLVVTLTAHEYRLYSENADIFKELGFVIEEFGTMTVRITAVPNVFDKAQDESFFRDALEALAKSSSLTMKSAKRDAIISASCKSAVKSGSPLPKEFIESLLEEYKTNETPLTCPHGRPVMVAITKKSLYKMFKRIV
jgi:DNA mismatch repair protein MutL